MLTSVKMTATVTGGLCTFDSDKSLPMTVVVVMVAETGRFNTNNNEGYFWWQKELDGEGHDTRKQYLLNHYKRWWYLSMEEELAL